MKIRIISDGKFGDRAYDVIRDKIPAEWIMVPYPGSPVGGRYRIINHCQGRRTEEWLYPAFSNVRDQIIHWIDEYSGEEGSG